MDSLQQEEMCRRLAELEMVRLSFLAVQQQTISELIDMNREQGHFLYKTPRLCDEVRRNLVANGYIITQEPVVLHSRLPQYLYKILWDKKSTSS